MRSAFVVLHRWFGLFIAVFLFVSGLTGAVISWDHELDDVLNPHLMEARTPGASLPPCRADVAQLTTAVLNLAVNARDAMPGGGTLALSTDAVSLGEDAVARDGWHLGPGAYVRLRVTDTGQGIPADALGRVFEPYFTTKPVGAGAGLGLAMLFGYAATRLAMPPLVGYLLAGIVISPTTPGFAGDLHIAGQLSEIGVMLLMFGVLVGNMKNS